MEHKRTTTSISPAKFPHSGIAASVLLAVAGVGFWFPYFANLPAADRYTHLHVVTILPWMLLLIAQPLLIRFRRPVWHRAWVGPAAFVVAPLVVVTMILLAHQRINLPGALSRPDAVALLFIQLTSAAMFGACVTLALAFRTQPAWHARWMLSTALLLIDPIQARILIHYFPARADAAEWLGIALTSACVLILMLLERNAKAGRAIFPAVLALLLAQFVAVNTVVTTTAWLAVSRGFAALPLT